MKPLSPAQPQPPASGHQVRKGYVAPAILWEEKFEALAQTASTIGTGVCDPTQPPTPQCQ